MASLAASAAGLAAQASELAAQAAALAAEAIEKPARNGAAPEPARPPAFRWAPGEADRLSLHPIRHPDIWQYRKKLESLHWTAQEVDMTRDRRDWDTRMSPEERHYVKHQLAFFARADIDVLANLDENFSAEVDCLEAQMVYAAQKDQECAHTEAYNLQIEAVMDGAEREAALNAVRTMPAVAQMREWVLRWFDRGLPVGERLVAFGLVEGVLFQNPFAALRWLKERNLLPGVTEYNDYIARDEGIHTLFACLLIREYLAVRPSQERVAAIAASMVALVDAHTDGALPARLIGMNADLMKQHARFQTNSVLADMGYAPLYDVGDRCPLPFMDKLTLNEVKKVNFFEARATQYQNVVRAGAARLVLDTTPVDA
jgi:ribonucleotide reductase beta subunit family protein with ferritin-like domain